MLCGVNSTKCIHCSEFIFFHGHVSITSGSSLKRFHLRGAWVFRVAYRSVLRADLGQAEIDALLLNASQHNAREGLTSAILIHQRQCIHALEGPPKLVRSVLEKIWDDRRNEEFAVMDIVHGDGSLFPDWPLKIIDYATLTAEPELRNHTGVVWLANLGGGLDQFFTLPALRSAPLH